MRPDQYIHGTTPAEQQRLSLLNDLINQASLRELGLSGGERFLDIGSGLAQFTRTVARAVGPAGRVVGIENEGIAAFEAWSRRADSALWYAICWAEGTIPTTV